MNMILTLVSMNQGLHKLKIKPVIGTTYFKEIEADKLQDFLTACEFYCEANGYNFHWIIADQVKKVVKKGLESLAMNDTNNES